MMTLQDKLPDSKSMHVENFYIQIDQRGENPPTQLYVETISHSTNPDTPVIFLPGGPGADHQQYKKDYSKLFKDRNFIFWDPRGCGKSGTVDLSTYTIDTYVDDVACICNQLGLEKIIVLGSSCGAIASLRFASKYPEMTEKLAVVSGAYNHHTISLALKNLKQKGSKDQIAIAQKLFNGTLAQDELSTFLKFLAPLYSYRIGKKKKLPSFEAINLNVSVATHGFTTYLTTFDYTEDCKKINCPTAIFAGKEDWICDVSQSEEMSNLIPQNRLYVYEKASHLLTSDVADLYFRDLLNFLSV